MLQAGAGLSSDPRSVIAAEAATREALAMAGLDHADLVLLFFTVDHVPQIDEVLHRVAAIAGTERITGSSAMGVLATQGEVEHRPGVAVMVLGSGSLSFEPLLCPSLRERDASIGSELAERCRARSGCSSLAVLFPDAYNAQPQRLLSAFREHAGGVPVVGAGSSENGTQGRTFQVMGRELATNALSALILSGPFKVFVDVTQGCQPISRPMTITRADGNLIYEIDRRPALEVFLEILKGPLREDLKRALAFVFVGLPADRARNSVEPGDYLVRNIVGGDAEKGILAVGEKVEEGERLIFTLRDSQRAREDLQQMLERQRKALNGRTPRFGLYFNCCARGASLYGMSDVDTAFIQRSLGEFPLAGFFGSFELGPVAGQPTLLAYTGVLALVTEEDA